MSLLQTRRMEVFESYRQALRKTAIIKVNEALVGGGGRPEPSSSEAIFRRRRLCRAGGAATKSIPPALLHLVHRLISGGKKLKGV